MMKTISFKEKSAPTAESKIKNKKAFNPFKKLKKKFKVVIFLLGYLISFASIITGAGYLIYNNTFSCNDSIFNPDSNIDLWNDYYNAHQKNHQLINLDNTINFLKQDISLTVNKSLKEKVINFKDIISEIDRQLLLNNIEAPDINNDNNQLLPNNFFKNVAFNPAVNFTVFDESTKQEVTAGSYSFSLADKYGTSNKYWLKMTIDGSANAFGIDINQTTQIKFAVNIINSICVDLKDLSISFENQNISTSKDNANMTIDQMWKNYPKIEYYIRKKFIDILLPKLSVPEIPDNSYTINYSTTEAPTTTLNFNQPKGININIFIVANETQNNQLGFKGTLKTETINIKNTQIDLKELTDLKNQINDVYKDKDLEVIVANDSKNDDTNLSQTQLDQVNHQISDKIKVICQKYFKEKDESLDIKNSNYIVSTNLQYSHGSKKGSNIFNMKQGQATEITINASKDTQKFVADSNLKDINVIVRGKNENAKQITWISPAKCLLNGIEYGDHLNDNLLQDGHHKYEQTTLLQYLVTNLQSDISFLNIMKQNSYQNPTNFKGKIFFNGTLDDNCWAKSKEFDISTISNKSAGISNLFDLLNKTTDIELETNVSTDSQNRTLDNVKFNFLTGDKYKNVIYTLDLTDLFRSAGQEHGIAIRDENTAKLIFTEFKINTTFNQFS